MFKLIAAYLIFFNFIFISQTTAADNPDELYLKGRFAEAEKIYSKLDMDNPQDIRYRYNRGCAAFQNSDHRGAKAAFSSVFRRAENDEVRFKTTYNLGNIAFSQADFSSALAHYKQALLFSPENEDAKYNMELAIRELEKQKKDKTDEPKSPPSGNSTQPEDQKDRSDDKSKESSEQKKPGEESKTKPNQGEEETKDPSKKKSDDKSNGRQKAEDKSPRDLSGELKPLHGMPENRKDNETSDSAASMIDKKKAEALLDNIREDRSRFLKLQVPENKKHGVPSGKYW